jgi:hypothetical protein
MADQDPNQDRQDRNLEVPGDTDSPDIVDRTGEQMPRQSHDGLEDSRDGDTRSTGVNDEGREQDSGSLPRHSADGAKAGDTSAGRHDNPRTGRISDW